MKITVIGAGNGGQAMAAHLSLLGHEVTLYTRSEVKAKILRAKGGIRLEGCLNGTGHVAVYTSDLAAALRDAKIIMVATVANAHREMAIRMAPHLQQGQIVVLNPGRTGGAFEFRRALDECRFRRRICLVEAQTLVYACRLVEEGAVNIVGVKEKVLAAALPAADTDEALCRIREIYPCFHPAHNVMETSLENIGAVFHPSIILLNAAAIERGEKFYFYRDITPGVIRFIERLDAERLAIGRAYGLTLTSARDWVAMAYDHILGDTLRERMFNNPAYYDITAPTTLCCRQLLEDIPTGFVPMLEFGRLAGVDTPLMEALLPVCSTLLGKDLRASARTLERMGLESMSFEALLNMVR